MKWNTQSYKLRCLSLTIKNPSRPWKSSRVYGRCKTDNESTGWYKIYRDFTPADPDPNAKPRLRSETKGVSGSRNTFGAAPYHTNVSVPVTVSSETTKFQVVICTVVGGAAVGLVLLLALVIVLARKVKEQRKRIEITNEEIDEFMLGIAAEKAQAKGINGLFILPYDMSLEIPKSDVTFSKSCGH